VSLSTGTLDITVIFEFFCFAVFTVKRHYTAAAQNDDVPILQARDARHFRFATTGCCLSHCGAYSTTPTVTVPGEMLHANQ
jgi:hypothetical protein